MSWTIIKTGNFVIDKFHACKSSQLSCLQCHLCHQHMQKNSFHVLVSSQKSWSKLQAGDSKSRLLTSIVPILETRCCHLHYFRNQGKLFDSSQHKTHRREAYQCCLQSECLLCNHHRQKTLRWVTPTILILKVSISRKLKIRVWLCLEWNDHYFLC